MSEKDDTQSSQIDIGRPRGGVFDRDQGNSGQAYNREDAEQQEREDPSVRVDPDATGAGDAIAADGNDPPERGRRASFDPVRGSGSGDGGGKMAEDYASDAAAGSNGGEHVAAPGQSSGRE